MAHPPQDEWRGRTTEPGWPGGGRPKPQLLWSLWQGDTELHAEITEHPLGYEVRVCICGEMLYSFVRPTREAAEAEATVMKSQHLGEGWTGTA